MTRAEIIKMARDAGLGEITVGVWSEYLERFAALVAAAERNRAWPQDHWTEYERRIAAIEREACAQVCDLVAKEIDDTNGTATYIGKAIRARGEK